MTLLDIIMFEIFHQIYNILVVKLTRHTFLFLFWSIFPLRSCTILLAIFIVFIASILVILVTIVIISYWSKCLALSSS